MSCEPILCSRLSGVRYSGTPISPGTPFKKDHNRVSAPFASLCSTQTPIYTLYIFLSFKSSVGSRVVKPSTKPDKMGWNRCIAAPLVVLVCTFLAANQVYSQRLYQRNIPYYLHPCSRADPNVNQCLTYAANHLAMNFRRGIPELGVTEVEPIIIDEINLALGAGPDGYRATFKNIEAYGVSNVTITGVRSDLNTLQIQLALFIPRISVRANYRSSGVLIMVQATGGGDYWGEYSGVRAKVYLRVSPHMVDGQEMLKLEDLKMDFSVKEMQMGIRNVHNGNAVLEAALNLFINSNAQDLLREMKPSIKKKLLVTMRHFIDNLFDRVPYSYWITD